MIYPVKSKGHPLRIQTRQNGEFMAMMSDGTVRRWQKTDDGMQEFRFANSDAEGRINIIEPSANEVLDVNEATGWLTRHRPVGVRNQRFKLEPIDVVEAVPGHTWVKSADNHGGMIPTPPAPTASGLSGGEDRARTGGMRDPLRPRRQR